MCNHDNLAKHGKDRKGCQRWKCRSCGTTVINNEHCRPLGKMRLEKSKALAVLGMLLEGMSIRACERITGVQHETICDLVLHVGQNCERFLEENVRNVPAKTIQLDEQWDFFGAKAKTALAKNRTDAGDIWSWFAIDADTKMILAHVCGNRDDATCGKFLSRLENATTGRCQVTSDGFRSYTYGVPSALGSRCDFAQLIKNYSSTQAETRYSPATISGIEKVPRFGNPDESKISTSYIERFNLTVRMQVRRMTRLTNAHSKTAHHHTAMIALFVAFYCYCRRHETLKGKTPAMAAGLADRVWTLSELLAEAA
jgi:transposase-like protein/IS1 family transposase